MRQNSETIASGRVLLRRWREEDLLPFAAINADPVAMRFMPSLLSPEETRAWMERIDAHFREHGFGLWVVELPGIAGFAGFTGLQRPSFEAAFTPCIEIGWRFLPTYWGKGYATEAAGAALAYGFDTLGLEEIVSFTVMANKPSWSVMERNGMTRNPDEDFDHPRLPEGHKLRRHILYRKRRVSRSCGQNRP
jgi:ribosomal-protein-alanine N-acetyltransferase